MIRTAGLQNLFPSLSPSITRFYTTNIWLSQKHFETAFQIWFLANIRYLKMQMDFFPLLL